LAAISRQIQKGTIATMPAARPARAGRQLPGDGLGLLLPPVELHGHVGQRLA